MLVALSLAANTWLLTAAAHAQLLPEELDSAGFEVHAFVSQGFALSTANNYLTDTKKGSLDFTEAAINIRRPIGERLTVGMQLFTRKVDPNDNYLPTFDWFNVDYRFADWLESDAAGIHYVAATPGAVAYISSAVDPAPAKVLMLR